MKTADSDKRRKKKENKKNKNESKPEELPDNEDYIESKKNKKRKLQSQQDAAPEMKGEDENTSAKKNKKKGRKDKNKNKEKNKDEEGLGGCDDEEEEEQKRNKKSRVITDERFASAQFDPRFRRMPRKESKVTIDSRFARIFSDKNFGRSAAPVDKRGKPRKGDEVNPLLHYYLHQKDEEEEKVEREEDGRKLEMEVSGEEEEEEEMELDVSDSDGSTSTEDEEDDDDDQYSVSSDIAHYLMANHEDTPITENESHRLAVVNMDWDHIKAVDLYVVMSSCVPKGGQISSVSIYPSEFGLKCMETEAVHGPSALVDVDDGGDDSENDSDIDNDKLRNYELNKLRYYYAVVVCDSSATSSHLYKTLDSTELLKTSNVFDLRFIPDSMEFKHPPRDVATEAPAGYKEPNFQTRALQHSRVKLTWEDDEPERKKVLRRQFNPNQLDELNEYLASTDDSDDDDDDDDDDDNDNGDSDRENDFTSNGKAKKRLGREKFLALLQSGDGDNSDEDKSDKDMEITFNTELEDLSKRIIEKKDKKSETVWEAVLRKRNEKKKARKGRSKYSSDDDTSDNEGRGTTDEPDDFFVEEPSDTETMPRKEKKGQKSKDKGRNKEKDQSPERQDQEASRAELELLFADDQDSDHGPKGYNLKAKKAKGKKGKEKPTEDKLPDVNIDNDPRFSALSTSHHYALDPTDPQYKRSATYIRQRSRK